MRGLLATKVFLKALDEGRMTRWVRGNSLEEWKDAGRERTGALASNKNPLLSIWISPTAHVSESNSVHWHVSESNSVRWGVCPQG